MFQAEFEVTLANALGDLEQRVRIECDAQLKELQASYEVLFWHGVFVFVGVAWKQPSRMTLFCVVCVVVQAQLSDGEQQRAKLVQEFVAENQACMDALQEEMDIELAQKGVSVCARCV